MQHMLLLEKGHSRVQINSQAAITVQGPARYDILRRLDLNDAISGVSGC
jgi:hypothetical protein